MSPKKKEEIEEVVEEVDEAKLQDESKKATESFIVSQSEKTTNPEATKRTYTEDEVRAMLQQVQKGQSDDLGDADAPEIKKCTIPRFTNKFVIAFKNMNTDEYSKEAIYAFNVFDQNTRRNIPWVTLIFDDKSELAVPLNTAIDKSVKITCDLIQIKEVDASYDFGKVERQEVPDGKYSKVGSGVMVKTKVTQKIYSYVVKLPEPDGREVEISRDVINWESAKVKES